MPYDPGMKRAISRKQAEIEWKYRDQWWELHGDRGSARASFFTGLSIGLYVGMNSMYKFIHDLYEEGVREGRYQ